MGFWSWLTQRKDRIAAPLAKIEEEKVDVQQQMEKSRSGLQREARERLTHHEIERRLVDEFEVATKAANAAGTLRRQRRERF